MVELTNLIRSTHEHSKQVVSILRDEFYTALSTQTNSVEALMKAVTRLSHKKRKPKATEIDVALSHLHEWTKADVALNLLHCSKGIKIYPVNHLGLHIL